MNRFEPFSFRVNHLYQKHKLKTGPSKPRPSIKNHETPLKIPKTPD